ncbi:methyltransferase domain-containing protein [Brevundimonas sp. NPDC090276]|uniref:methyltransferase domain-containing protein n=1 Tax=Brevundimonas sp. NPDC090276 TaxID=3363956 RepID=UPI00383BB81C
MSAAARVQRSFRRGFATYDDSALVQKLIARGLIRRLQRHAVGARLAHVFEAGYGTGQLTRLLLQRLPIEALHLNDLAAEPLAFAPEADYRPGDIEFLSLPEDLDLAISASMIQWIADPQTLIRRLCDAVRPGGWLALSGFGPDHFPELQALGSQAAAPSLLSADAMAGLLPTGWTLQEKGSRARSLCFASPCEALRHLRDTGVNGRASRPWTRRDLDAFCHDYDAQFGKAGRVPLTYQPVWLIAQKA